MLTIPGDIRVTALNKAQGQISSIHDKALYKIILLPMLQNQNPFIHGTWSHYQQISFVPAPLPFFSNILIY